MISIVIPFSGQNFYLTKNLKHLSQFNKYPFEVILVPDFKINLDPQKYNFEIKIIESGVVSPARKRDIGANISKFNFLFFIDDDAYISDKWFGQFLSKTDKLYSKYSCIVGPGLTPKDDSFYSKIISNFYYSKFLSLFPERFLPLGKAKEVQDWPTVNFCIKKDVFNIIGGFNTDLWPGEDTLLCKKLVAQNFKILYDPELTVFHYRRSSITKSIRQIYRYGFHRGILFFDLGYKNQKKFYIFLLLIFILFIFLILLSFISNHSYITLTFLFYASYIFLSFIEINFNNPNFKSIFIFLIAPIFQFSYFYGFIKGLFKNQKSKSKLGR